MERQCLLGLLRKCNFYNEALFFFFFSFQIPDSLDPGNNVEVLVRESRTVAIPQKRERKPKQMNVK